MVAPGDLFPKTSFASLGPGGYSMTCVLRSISEICVVMGAGAPGYGSLHCCLWCGATMPFRYP